MSLAHPRSREPAIEAGLALAEGTGLWVVCANAGEGCGLADSEVLGRGSWICKPGDLGESLRPNMAWVEYFG